MKKWIVFIISFFLTFNLAFFTGFKFSKLKDKMIEQKKVVADFMLKKIIEEEVNEIAARRAGVSEEGLEGSDNTSDGEMSEVKEAENVYHSEKKRDESVKVDVSQETAPVIQKSEANYQELYKKWNKPREVLSSFTNIIKIYGETDGLEKSSKKLFNDMNVYSKKLNKEVKTLTGVDMDQEFYEFSSEEMNEFLSGKKLISTPFKMKDMYISILKMYYGGILTQKPFMASVNRNYNEVSAPDIKRFVKITEKKHVVKRNGMIKKNDNYKEVNEIIETIRELLPEETIEDVLRIQY